MDKLSDGSHIVKVHRVWSTGDSRARLNMIEATTSYGTKVLATAGDGRVIGRSYSDSEPRDEFHLLDYDCDMTTFSDVCVESGAAVAIDECGEVWILAGETREHYLNLGLSCK